MKRSELLACIDAIAMEVAQKIADYNRIRGELEQVRARVLAATAENVPRNFDTHELVSQRLGRRRTA